MKVTMFVKNSFEYDARVTREARSLIAAGYEVTVIALMVPDVTPEREVRADGIRVRRVYGLTFGGLALNRLAARITGSIERRHTALTGEPCDLDRVAWLNTIHGPSTATPGDAARTVQAVDAFPPPERQPGPLSRLWGGLTTPVLRSAVALGRFGLRVKALLGRYGRALKTVAINRQMIRAGLETGADVFHAHDLNALFVGSRCKKRTGRPLVYDSHELATERNRMGFWWRAWARWNERRWIRWADAIIVVSPSQARYLTHRYSGIPEPATVLNVPEDGDPQCRDLKAALGIAPTTPLLLYQGSIQENRGIEAAIEAVALLPDAVLAVIGYGHHRPTLEAEVARRRLQNRVRFFGPVPNTELIAWAASADIGLCNILNSSLSYHTALPNKLFEYIAAGIPVIGSDSPEIGRVIAETGVGEVCNPGDPAAIAAASAKILADPAPYRSATAAAAERYRWKVEQRTLLDLYQRLER